MGFFDLLFGWLRPKPGNAAAAARAVRSAASRLPDFARTPGGSPLANLASRLSLSRRRLAYWALHAEKLYVSHELIKRNGSVRRIDAPVPQLKFIQRRILSRVLNGLRLAPCVRGFRKRYGIFGNARIHVGQPMVINLDLKDFFPTITAGRVFGFFKSLGQDAATANLLTRLTTWQGRLPQGAPTSPAVSNGICRKLDSRLAGLAKRAGANYSRYADDLTFSGPASIRSLLPLVRRIIAEEGFTVAEHKVHISRSSRRQQVTGLTVNEKVNVPRPLRRHLRAAVHNLLTRGLTGADRSDPQYALLRLRGRLEFLRSINEPQGRKLLALLDKATI